MTSPSSAPAFSSPARLALVIGSGGVRGASAIGVADVLSRGGV
jgi:predicted acylesterase/phospholipase RssA